MAWNYHQRNDCSISTQKAVLANFILDSRMSIYIEHDGDEPVA